MNIEDSIRMAIKVEVGKAIEEEIKLAEGRIRDRISEIAARVPIRVIKEKDMRESRSVYSVVIDNREEARSSVRG